MKPPFKDPIVRVRQQDPNDLKLRRHARNLERAMTIKMNSPEIKEQLRKAIMNEVFPSGIRKI